MKFCPMLLCALLAANLILSSTCPDVVVDGVNYGTTPIVIYDYKKNGTTPIGFLNISEAQPFNSFYIDFGRDSAQDLAMISLSGGGIVFYDFSDPRRPVAVSAVDRFIDPAKYNQTVSYSVGAINSAYGGTNAAGDESIWYAGVYYPGDTYPFLNTLEVVARRNV